MDTQKCVVHHMFLNDLVNPKLFVANNHIAKFLGLLNIKYCLLPQEQYAYEIFGKDLHRNFFLSTFNKQEGLEKINIGGNIDIYENRHFYPYFFTASNVALVVGARQVLFELASLDSMDFSKWILFFADEFLAAKRTRPAVNNISGYQCQVRLPALKVIADHFKGAIIGMDIGKDGYFHRYILQSF